MATECEGAVLIGTGRVDSTAMLSAYLAVVRPSDPWYGKLVLRYHRSLHLDGPPPASEAVHCLPCDAPLCHRCRIGQGGYAFRWFHKAWEEQYVKTVKMRKMDSVWLPDETDEDAARKEELFLVVPQAIDVKLSRIDPDDGVNGVELLRRRYRRNHVVTPSRVESVQQLRLSGEARVVREVVDDN